MARPNFLAENQGRTFPFTPHFQEELAVSEESLSAAGIYNMQNLPNDAIVDFGCIMGVQSYFVEGTSSVYLFEIRREGSLFVFEFRSTAPGLEEYALSFSRSVTSDDFETEYSDALPITLDFSQSASNCVSDVNWEGYLVTGSMLELAELLDDDGDKLKGDELDAIVEPALVHNMSYAHARSINLANADRTRADNADDCDSLVWPFTIQPIYVNHLCAIGKIRFKPGYNCVIDQDSEENSITIGAEVAAGEGEPCDEVLLFDSESPPTGETLVTGGPACNEVFRSINGVGGRVVDILSGAGVVINSDPENHQIVVDINLHDLAVCYSPTSESSM